MKTTKWVCDKKNTLKCKARARLDVNKEVKLLNPNHNHEMSQSDKLGPLIDIEGIDLNQFFVATKSKENSAGLKRMCS